MQIEKALQLGFRTSFTLHTLKDWSSCFWSLTLDPSFSRLIQSWGSKEFSAKNRTQRGSCLCVIMMKFELRSGDCMILMSNMAGATLSYLEMMVRCRSQSVYLGWPSCLYVTYLIIIGLLLCILYFRLNTLVIHCTLSVCIKICSLLIKHKAFCLQWDAFLTI